ncbi:hypothetical protein AB685_08765 [Bacillus sp. LL01]|nr:hypothetical protein AB685_08765 [Bacillus sp. LL01]
MWVEGIIEAFGLWGFLWVWVSLGFGVRPPRGSFEVRGGVCFGGQTPLLFILGFGVEKRSNRWGAPL